MKRRARKKLPAAQWVSFRKVLLCVERNPGATCDDIAEDLDMPAVVASAVLTWLKRHHWVTAEGSTRARGYYVI